MGGGTGRKFDVGLGGWAGQSLSRPFGAPPPQPSRIGPVLRAVVAGTMLATAAVAPPAGAAAAAPLTAVPPVSGASAPAELTAADETSATALAYRTRQSVLVTGLTTETSLTWAQPDGTYRSTVSLTPERVHQDSGRWVDIDLTMERKPDGSVGPRVSARPLRLSGARSAGTDTLVSLGAGDQRTDLGWRGALPAPVLAGNRATYQEVKPGVDLVIEARSAGYEYSVVVKNARGAANVASVAMPWRTGSLTPTPLAGGGLQLRAASGESAVVPAAQMWDARLSPTSGEPAHREAVPMSTTAGAGGTDLVLTPDPTFFQDPQLTYPVTIDPPVNLTPAYDAFVENTISSTDMSGDPELKLGYNDDADGGCGSGCTARSFLSFHFMDSYKGASVVSAELFLWNNHSWSCTATQWEAWRTSYVTYSARWNNQPAWTEKDGTSSGTKGYSGCGAGWVSASVKNTFQHTFDVGDSTTNIGLRATSESNHNGWKRFNSSEASSNRPYVTLTWNRKPNVPGNQSIDSCYSACASPAVVRSGTPQLSATVSDPDAGTLRAEYEVYDNSHTTLKAKSGTAVTGVTSGSARPWRVVPVSGAALPDGTYQWRVRGCDSYTCGDYSAWFTFTVNTQDPSLPAVSGAPYTERSTGTWNGGPGQTGSFTFGPNGSTDVAEYIYSLNSASSVTVPAGASQAELLTPNQQQVSTDLTGFASGNVVNTRSTSLGHNSPTSLQVVPGTTATPESTSGDTRAALGSEYVMALGMQAGKRYAITGWIYVPAATGLNPTDQRGLRIVAITQRDGAYISTQSARPTAVDGWQQLTVTLSIPSGATQAFVRLYNGFVAGSNKSVYWDDLSVREVVGGSTTQSITPDRDGLNVLQVQSRNSAGATSDPKVYQFLVAPSSGSWAWSLDEGTGTTAASVPNTRPATLSPSGVTWTSPGRVGAAAVSLAGAGDLSTSSPVLNTTAAAGFTVAAWVRFTGSGDWQTAVSQDGTQTSMFRLGYRADRDLNGDGVPDPAWCFTVKSSDSGGSGSSAACTTDYVVPGDWVSLVGVYDQAHGKVELYVNGTPDIGGSYAETATGAAWSATGPFAIGRAWQDAAPSDRWGGDLDHVYAVQQVWPDSKINQHALQ